MARKGKRYIKAADGIDRSASREVLVHADERVVLRPVAVQPVGPVL